MRRPVGQLLTRTLFFTFSPSYSYGNHLLPPPASHNHAFPCVASIFPSSLSRHRRLHLHPPLLTLGPEDLDEAEKKIDMEEQIAADGILGRKRSRRCSDCYKRTSAVCGRSGAPPACRNRASMISPTSDIPQLGFAAAGHHHVPPSPPQTTAFCQNHLELLRPETSTSCLCWSASGLCNRRPVDCCSSVCIRPLPRGPDIHSVQ